MGKLQEERKSIQNHDKKRKHVKEMRGKKQRIGQCIKRNVKKEIPFTFIIDRSTAILFDPSCAHHILILIPIDPISSDCALFISLAVDFLASRSPLTLWFAAHQHGVVREGRQKQTLVSSPLSLFFISCSFHFAPQNMSFLCCCCPTLSLPVQCILFFLSGKLYGFQLFNRVHCLVSQQICHLVDFHVKKRRRKKQI